MWDKNMQNFYEVSITQENIEKSPTLPLKYCSTEELFLDMKESINQILISEDGVITIEVSLQMIGKNCKKTLSFYPVRCDALDTTEIESHLNSNRLEE
jgi:hypothetical protein